MVWLLHQRSLAEREAGFTDSEAHPLLAPRETFGDAKRSQVYFFKKENQINKVNYF